MQLKLKNFFPPAFVSLKIFAIYIYNLRVSIYIFVQRDLYTYIYQKLYIHIHTYNVHLSICIFIYKYEQLFQKQHKLKEMAARYTSVHREKTCNSQNLQGFGESSLKSINFCKTFSFFEGNIFPSISFCPSFSVDLEICASEFFSTKSKI